MALWAGMSRVDITPRPGMPMAGYLDRADRARGALDPLYARALYLDDGSTEALIIVLDLIHIDNSLYHMLRETISRSLGVKNVIIAATHTHSGPEVSIDIWSTRVLSPEEIEAVKEYRRELSRLVLCAAMRAIEESARSVVEVRRGFLDCCSNRIDSSKPSDPEALVLTFVDSSSRSIEGVLVNYACHPTVLDSSNNLYSGDLFGYISRELERLVGATTMVVNGAAGNVSTRFSRQLQGVEELERLGSRAFSRLLDALCSPPTAFVEDGLEFHRRTISLSTKRFPPIEELERKRDEAYRELEKLKSLGAPPPVLKIFASRAYAFDILARRIREGVPRSLDIEIAMLRIGRVIALTFPGELFVEYQLSVKRVAEASNLLAMIIGYSNGYIGYVPYPGYEDESYEELMSLIDPGDRVKLREFLETLVMDLGGAQ